MSNRGPTEGLKGYDKCEGDCEGCQGCPPEIETAPSQDVKAKKGPKEVDWVKTALEADLHPVEEAINKRREEEQDEAYRKLFGIDSDPHPVEDGLEMKIEIPSDIYGITQSKRTFDTGACRDSDEGKYSYEGFLSPLVLQRYAEYMHKNRKMKDGSLRSSDNWQKGIPKDQYMESLIRHNMDVWLLHRGEACREDDLSEALCGIIFNSMGMLYEILQEDKELERIT